MDQQEPQGSSCNVTETQQFGLRVIVKEEDVNDEEYGHLTACQDEEERSLAQIQCKTETDLTESNEILQITVEKEEEDHYQLNSKAFQI